MGYALLDRILVHLIGFHRGIGQDAAHTGLRGPLLELVTSLEEVLAVHLELLRQVQIQHPLVDASEDAHAERAALVRPLPDGSGKGVVDANARAAVVQHRRSIPAMDARVLDG
jgi:hypothetical protein